MKVSDIKLNPDNPRFIRDDRFQKLKDNIKAFPKMMKLRPIVIDDNGIILGGNMRYRALTELGYNDLPEGWVVKASELTDDEKRRFIITDNIGYGEFDMDLLANEWDLEELQEWGVELGELDTQLEEAEEDDFDVDKAVDETKEPICKLGDIWQLGNHRIMCGDSTKREDVEKLMNGKKADMVFTDPPYGINYNVSISNNKGKKGSWEHKAQEFNAVIGDNKEYNPQHIFNLFGYCKEIFLWGADYYSERLENKNNGSWVVWDKRAGIEDIKLTFSEFELCWSKNRHSREIARVRWTGLLGTEQEFDHNSGRQHPTQKPIKLAEWFINKYSQKDNLIIDLFLGSGSTLIACEQLNRICYGMEIDPIYCDVIIKRWEELTQKKAVKL
jgi:DNA modification methylase